MGAPELTIVWLWLVANAVAFVVLAIELLNLREFPELAPAEEGEPVDVYVAMRDEEEHCEAALRALLATRGVARVIVADDASADATATIASSIPDDRLVVFKTSGGKSAALTNAVAYHPPRAPWVLFVDADVRLAPGAAYALQRFARRRGMHAATAWPKVRPPSFWSMLMAPSFTLFLLQLMPMRLARGTDPRFCAGNGQCFLIRTDAYLHAGGHEPADIVEDVALVKRLKRAGFTVALASAAGIAAVEGYRTYGQNARSIGRSLFCGAGPIGCVTAALWLLCLLLSPLMLYPARIATAWRMRESIASVVLAPLGIVLTLAAVLLALFEGLNGRIEWRGRRLVPANRRSDL